MFLELLITPELKPVPETVRVVEDYGEIVIIVEEGRRSLVGDHAILEGAPEAFKAWLRPFSGFWVGSGCPLMQQFHVAHIRD